MPTRSPFRVRLRSAWLFVSEPWRSLGIIVALVGSLSLPAALLSSGPMFEQSASDAITTRILDDIEDGPAGLNVAMNATFDDTLLDPLSASIEERMVAIDRLGPPLRTMVSNEVPLDAQLESGRKPRVSFFARDGAIEALDIVSGDRDAPGIWISATVPASLRHRRRTPRLERRDRSTDGGATVNHDLSADLSAAVSDDLDASVVIEVRSVTKRFRSGPDTINAVDDASFSLHRGMFAALSGPSGSGKTTLLNIVLGWEEPDEGAVVGVPDMPDWSSVSVVPQSLGLLPHLTLVENITMPTKVAGGARVSTGAAHDEHLRLMDALHITHLASRFPHETSLGEQQRAAIARALITAPRLLVADEPTSHQDELSTERIIDELMRAASDGTTILVATHDTRLTEPADVLLLIDDGVVTTWRQWRSSQHQDVTGAAPGP